MRCYLLPQPTFAQDAWEGDTGTARRRRKTGSNTAMTLSSLGLDMVLSGKPRLHASRWFFELLVLKSQGFVELHQPTPYADISISAASQLSAATVSSG